MYLYQAYGMVLHLPSDQEHLLKALSEKQQAIASEITLNHILVEFWTVAMTLCGMIF